MSLPPNFKNIAQGKFGGLLCGPQQAGWVEGNPPLSGQPVTIQQAVYIAFAVQDWEFTGSVDASYVGDADPDDAPDPSSYSMTFDDSTYKPKTWTYGGTIDNNPSYLKQFTGLAAITGTDFGDVGGGGGALGEASIFLTAGFPGLCLGLSSDPVYLDGSNIFLGATVFSVTLQLGAAGGITSDPKAELPANGGVDSGISFDIAGVPVTLWNTDSSDWEFSGSLSLKPKTYWTCGGAYSSTTGEHT